MVYRAKVRVGDQEMNVVIVEEYPGYWLSQVLEKDISHAGATPQDALAALSLPIAHEVESVGLGKPLFEYQPQAPRDYWRKHKGAIQLPS